MDGGLARCGNGSRTYRARIGRRAAGFARGIHETVSWRGRSWEELLTFVLVMGGLRFVSMSGLIAFSSLTVSDLLAVNSVGSVTALVAYLVGTWLRRHDAWARALWRFVARHVRRRLPSIPLRSLTALEETTASRRFAPWHPARIVWGVLRRVRRAGARLRSMIPIGGPAPRPRL